MVISPHIDSSRFALLQRNAAKSAETSATSVPVRQENNQADVSRQTQLAEARQQRISNLQQLDRQQLSRQQPSVRPRPVSHEEARTATPVNDNNRGYAATQTFLQVQSSDENLTLVDVFA